MCVSRLYNLRSTRLNMIVIRVHRELVNVTNGHMKLKTQTDFPPLKLLQDFTNVTEANGSNVVSKSSKNALCVTDTSPFSRINSYFEMFL